MHSLVVGPNYDRVSSLLSRCTHSSSMQFLLFATRYVVLFYLIKDRLIDAIFRFDDNPMGRVVRFWAKIWQLTLFGHRILKSDFIPSDFTKSDCMKQAHPCFRSTKKNRSSQSDRIINGLSLDAGPRPGPAHRIFEVSQPGSARSIIFSQLILGPTRPAPSQI